MVVARFPDHHTCGARHIEPARMLQMTELCTTRICACRSAAAARTARRADNDRALAPACCAERYDLISNVYRARRHPCAATGERRDRLVAKQQWAERLGLQRGRELNEPHRVRNSPFGYSGSAPSGNWRFASVMSVIVPMRPLNVPPSISAVENAATQRVLPFSRSRYST